MKKVLGISAFYHDSAAALLCNGDIIAAAQEERFTRIKHNSDFPINAIKYCLQDSGLSIDDLDAVVFYDKPLLKFERLLETYYEYAPKGLSSFIKSIPKGAKEKLFLKKCIRDGLANVENYNRSELKLLFSEHHLAHAASAFYSSPFQEAAILTIDGVGEWATTSIYQGKGNKIVKLKEMRYPHSIGLLYSAFTYYLGFKVNSGEYKLMGLAPFGIPEEVETKAFIKKIKENLLEIKDDGSTWLNQEFFNYSTGLTMINRRKWEKLFGFPARAADEEIKQYHCNLAYAIQNVLEEIIIRLVKETKRITQEDNLCYAGGVALNCVANTKILRENDFKEIYIQPASGDAGGALGAAQAVNYMYFKENRIIRDNSDVMLGTFLGPQFTDSEVMKSLNKLNAVYENISDVSYLNSRVTDLLVKGNVVGWFQGRMEFGPRALGNRSILGDARNPQMQKKLNLKVKNRESFRPFAPSILSEDFNEYYEGEYESPYMLFNATLLARRRKELPGNYNSLELYDKLSFDKSEVPAITHVDFSSRVQTVTRNSNLKLWYLLKTFKEQTGCSMIINTSFNVRGEPLVCSPSDAYKCFMSTEMDYVVINNFILKKVDQPNWEKTSPWKTAFKPD